MCTYSNMIIAVMPASPKSVEKFSELQICGRLEIAPTIHGDLKLPLQFTSVGAKLRLASKVLVFLMILIFGMTSLFCETLAEPPSNFDEPNAGTEDNPYLISNLANLRWLSETPAVWGTIAENTIIRYCFLQTADIDAAETIDWYEGGGFNPIGHHSGYHDMNKMWHADFFGVYDGDNHKISNLSIFSPYHIPAIFSLMVPNALFGKIRNATIKNVRLENIGVMSNGIGDKATSTSFGTVVGEAIFSSIINCSASGQILNATFHDNIPLLARIGGIVGQASSSKIENCYSTVTIYGNQNNASDVGGLIGHSIKSTLKNSYFKGDIHSTTYAGGIVASSEYSTIQFCYVTSNNEMKNISNFIYETRNYQQESELMITNNFWDTCKTNIDQLIGLEILFGNITENNYGISSAEMKRYSTFVNNGWDFENVWGINPDFNDGYPFLRDMYPEISTSDFETENNIVPLVQSLVFPNPIRDSDVTIQWTNPSLSSLAKRGNTKISIYNVRGQLVKSSGDFQSSNGENVFVWNRRDDMGQEVANGVYLYRIQYSSVFSKRVENTSVTGKFLIVK